MIQSSPWTGSLLATDVIWQRTDPPHASEADTLMVTATSLLFAGDSTDGVAAADWIAGGVLSTTVTMSMSDEEPRCPSSTVSVIACVPTGSDTDAVAPDTVPNGPVHVNVNGSPSASDEAPPSSATIARQLASAVTV